jgi:hypothetical protein
MEKMQKMKLLGIPCACAFDDTLKKPPSIVELFVTHISLLVTLAAHQAKYATIYDNDKVNFRMSMIVDSLGTGRTVSFLRPLLGLRQLSCCHQS